MPTSVFIMKVDVIATRKGDNGEMVRIFASRNKIYRAEEPRVAKPHTQVREFLEEEAQKELRSYGNFVEVVSTRSKTLEVSRELLLELADLARCREDILADREPFETV